MCQKVEECHNKSIESSLNRNKDESLHFTLEQCHALNNIVFILQSVQSFPFELGKDNIISKIGESNGAQVADACKKTIDVLVQNAVEDVENQILQVIFCDFQIVPSLDIIFLGMSKVILLIV